MNILKENKKIFVLLLVISVIIVLCVIWLPKKDVELSHYKQFSDEEIDAKVSKEYGNDLLYSFYSQNEEYLTNKVLQSFLEFNNISKNDYFNWLKNNGFDTYNIKFGKTTKHTYKSTNIYSISCNFGDVNKNINIIETAPENWHYTIGSFVDFYNVPIKENGDSCGVIVNSIYQDLEYVELDCSLYVDDNDYSIIDVTQSDSVILTLSDKSSIIMATNNINFDEHILDNKKYIEFKCIFNIPIDLQDTITLIKFNTFSINEKDISINIKWNR